MCAKLKSFFAISLILLFAISQCVSPIRASGTLVTEEKIDSYTGNSSGSIIMRTDDAACVMA